MTDTDTNAEAPFVRSAFINAIAEEGSKTEAVEWLQKTWNEKCQAEAQADYEARILAAIEPAPVSVQEAARVLLDVFSEGASHGPQYQFWMAYWKKTADQTNKMFTAE
jgi:hypothetical protein